MGTFWESVINKIKLLLGRIKKCLQLPYKTVNILLNLNKK